MTRKLPVTVIIPVKNERLNLTRCISNLRYAQRILVIDSSSSDGSGAFAEELGAEVVQYPKSISYPKKRQWALDNIEIETPWVMFVDADEQISDILWSEIREIISSPDPKVAYLVKKRMHFFGQCMRYGGFSHRAVLFGRHRQVRFERLIEADPSGLDMEVHERVIVEGRIGRLRHELHHEDSKGISAYLARHNAYSTWEAAVRSHATRGLAYGVDTIRPKLTGNVQERRRFIKLALMRVPLEPLIWFLFHYVFCLGFLEGRRGWLLSRIRWNYIFEVRCKMYEMRQLRLKNGQNMER